VKAHAQEYIVDGYIMPAATRGEVQPTNPGGMPTQVASSHGGAGTIHMVNIAGIPPTSQAGEPRQESGRQAGRQVQVTSRTPRSAPHLQNDSILQ